MHRSLLAVLTPILAVLAAAAPAAAQVIPAPSTPQLIERANLDRPDELRMLAYALGRPDRLPQRFRSNAPWDGTFHLRRLQRQAPRLRDDAARREILAILNPEGESRINEEPSTNCSVLSVGPNPEVLITEHFYIEHPGAEAFVFGASLDDYAESLEGAWQKEVDEFGYPAPPFHPNAEGTDAEGKYNVRIGFLGAGLYGFVSSSGTYAGEVGDNPNTPWTEDDADASCMGLNIDYETGFEQLTVGTARQRLDATTAHEFLHSIQFGYGALDNGDHEPDLSFSEGHATWMEDEVYDGADDSHNYLYPDFRDSMGEHDEGSEYSYFLVWRGLLERFGTGTPGASEDVVQRFWEIISREEFGQMDAIENAYSPTGTSLATGYHDFARAGRFLKNCGGGYVLPFCFEEGDAYAEVAGERPEADGSIDELGGTYGTDAEPAEIEDNYALNWVDLPEGDTPMQLKLRKGGDTTRLRLSVICDTGSELRVSDALLATGRGGEADLRFDPAGCQGRPSAVITNETRTGGYNPDDSTFTTYVLESAVAPPPPAPETPPQTQPPSPPVTPFTAPPPPPVACAAGSRLGRAVAIPRGGGLDLRFSPRGGSRVGVDIFQASIGKRVIRGRLVARFRNRARSFRWDGESNLKGRRVRNGHLFVRFRARNASGMDVKRSALARSRGRFRSRPAFAQADRCATLASFKLLRPVFGGRTNRSLGVSYRLGSGARVTIEAIQKGVVVRRYRQGLRDPGQTYRLRVGASRFVRGNVTLRIRVERVGAPTITARLVARRL
jgi:hypothetical protein